MIRYALKCSDGHSFESWFQSADAFDKLAAAGMVSCAVCGATRVEKAIMAPRVRPARKAAAEPGAGRRPQAEAAQAPAAPAQAPGVLSAPRGELEAAIAELRRKVEANSDYVGKDFAAEARKMHLGEAPERAIHGEARPEEAKALLEDGVPVLPLPFRTNRNTN
ncbi:DUF1178 family protein [Roseobacteraceae bacterium NS-SX3]